MDYLVVSGEFDEGEIVFKVRATSLNIFQLIKYHLYLCRNNREKLIRVKNFSGYLLVVGGIRDQAVVTNNDFMLSSAGEDTSECVDTLVEYILGRFYVEDEYPYRGTSVFEIPKDIRFCNLCSVPATELVWSNYLARLRLAEHM